MFKLKNTATLIISVSVIALISAPNFASASKKETVQKNSSYIWLSENQNNVSDKAKESSLEYIGMTPVLDEQTVKEKTESSDNVTNTVSTKIFHNDITSAYENDKSFKENNSIYSNAKDTETIDTPVVDKVDSTKVNTAPLQDSHFFKSLSRTYLTNPNLEAQRENIRLSYETIIDAQTGWFPSISGTASALARYRDSDQSGSDDDTIKSAGATISQPLFRGGRTQNRISQRELESQAAYNQYLNDTQSILFDYISSYVDVVTALSEIDVNEQNVKRLKKQNEATQNEFDVGLLTLTDVSQSRARLAEAEASLIQARGILEQRLAAYTEITGERPPLDIFVMPDYLLTPMISEAFPNTLEFAERVSLISNPEWIASDLSLQALNYSVKAEESSLMPELSMTGSLQHQDYGGLNASGDNITDANVGLELSLPIFSAGTNRSKIRQAKITKFSEQQSHEALKRRIVQNTHSAWQNFTTAQSVLDAAKVRLEASETARDGVYNEREVGSRTVLDTLDAEQELLNAQLQLINAERDLLIGRMSVLQSTGLLSIELFGLEDVLETYNLKKMPSLSLGRVLNTSVKPMDK